MRALKCQFYRDRREKSTKRLENRILPISHCRGEKQETPVAIISLPESVERRSLLIDRGVPKGWIDHYWCGQDYRSVKAEALADVADIEALNRGIGREVTSAEIGCAASHRAVTEWLASAEHNMMLVFEDDIIPQRKNYIDELKNIISALNPHAASGAAFVCHIGAPFGLIDGVLKRRVLMPEEIGNQLQQKLWLHTDPVRGLWRAHAYLISRSAAIRAVSLERRIQTLADDWRLRRELGFFDELFFVDPRVFSQDEVVSSTIGHRRQSSCSSRSIGSRPGSQNALNARRWFNRVSDAMLIRAKIKKAQILQYFSYRIYD
ncbi:hypothetical protein HKCCSP123_11445 [Rhodobacterales bacterium HKCCSP123]|nr:hypothetical protein [Rhodobacterales bacterium HKCCSP123]